jgi:hypothetical protein
MSFFQSIEQDFAAVKVWFNGSSIGQAIEADYRSAVAELETVATADLENAVKVIGLAALGGLATGGTAGAIAAGIASAETEFKTVGKDVTVKTLNTLVSTVVNQVSAQTAPTPVVPPAV